MASYFDKRTQTTLPGKYLHLSRGGKMVWVKNTNFVIFINSGSQQSDL
jgi:hypothetical protein